MITEFAPAKINLALHILGRRPDGYHELDSIVAFADIGDELKFTPSTEFTLAASGPFARFLPQASENVIHAAWRAAAAIAQAQRKALPPVHVDLVKNLPVAAGIGGGSANAAATLRACLRLASIDASTLELTAAGLKLGADVPACLVSKACRMQGIGEIVVPMEEFAPLHAVLANPGTAVATGEIFCRMEIANGAAYRSPVFATESIRTWRNDLTDAAVALAPSIATVLEDLHLLPGALTARMSGSGATCFAVFETAELASAAAIQLAELHPDWWVMPTRLA